MTDQSELVPIFKIVDDFSSGTLERFEIPFELTNKQRSAVHEYIKQKGLYSESIQLKGSANKKIAILRLKQSDEKTCAAPKPGSKASGQGSKHVHTGIGTGKPKKEHKIVKSESEASEKHQPDVSDQDTIPDDAELDVETKEDLNLASRTENIDFFAQYTRAPFPCASPDYVDYYVKLFDPFYDTVSMWELFLDESKRLILRKEAADASKKIRDAFAKNTEYVKMMDMRLKGVETKMKKDVYSIPNIGKYFLSIDIRTANFTVLRKACPTLFTNKQGELMSWYQFVKQFTESEFICRSKYFRELVFGMTGFIGKAATLQEILMDKVHKTVCAWSTMTGNQLIPRMKCGDENVYELEDYESMVSMIDSLKEALTPEVCQDLHFRIFRVDQIETKIFFVKTFMYNSDWDASHESRSLKQKIEFKKVPKFFMPQIIKWYQKKPIQDEDLIFMHEGIMAQYKATIFE